MKKLLLMFEGLLITAVSFAEDRMNIDITPNRLAWYSSPWLWILGVFVFILLLVTIISGSGRNQVSSTKMIVSKKVIRNPDIDSDAGLL